MIRCAPRVRRPERRGLRAAGVDDPGNEALAAQAVGRPASRTRRGAGLQDLLALAIERESIEIRRETELVATFARGGRLEDPQGPVSSLGGAGPIVGVQGARYAGTKATNVLAPRRRQEHIEERHLKTAMKMVGALGQMKGAAMRLGQLTSLSSTPGFIPRGVPRDLPGRLRRKPSADAPGDVALVEGRWRSCPRRNTTENRCRSSSPRSSTRRSRRPRSNRCVPPARSCSTTARVLWGRVQYPGIAEALEASLRNAGTLVRLAPARSRRAWARGRWPRSWPSG